jgi:hypothetical protein
MSNQSKKQSKSKKVSVEEMLKHIDKESVLKSAAATIDYSIGIW